MIKISNIPGSKSISNRLLILQALYPNLEITNLSNAEDTKVMEEALQTTADIIDIGHAGTAMRFLTAYFSIQKKHSVVLDGSERMRERPVKILVDALKQIGADIVYKLHPGYPPLCIKGKKFSKNIIEISSNVSSQYISALLLIAPKLPHGLILKLTGKPVSKPYIDMTIALLRQIGVHVEQTQNKIVVYPKNQIDDQSIEVERDWSSASYFYSYLAVNGKGTLCLEGFFEHSWQGDSSVKDFFKKFGIQTIFKDDVAFLSIIPDFKLPKEMNFDLIAQPDLAQTLSVTCLALGVDCFLSGLKTLRIKETDRLLALKTEMEKLGAKVEITSGTLELQSPKNIKHGIKINTYNDHRMAMSFAVLASLFPIEISDREVVKKSFPNFWEVYPVNRL